MGTATRPGAGSQGAMETGNRDNQSGCSQTQSLLENVAGVAKQELASQLAKETKDNHNIKDTSCRLGGANFGGLPGHPAENERRQEADAPAHRQPEDGFIQPIERMPCAPGPEAKTGQGHAKERGSHKRADQAQKRR